MKKNLYKLFISLIFTIVVCIPFNVRADWADCYMTQNGKESVNVGDIFTLDIGTAGYTSGTNIYALHFVIEYNKEILEPILSTGNGVKSYYDWEVITTQIQEEPYLIVNYLIVDIMTNNKDKYVTEKNFDIDYGFLPLAGIKFRVKETNYKSTSINLLPIDASDGYYRSKSLLESYKMIYDDYYINQGQYIGEEEPCTENVKTYINIYKKAMLSNISIDGKNINNFNQDIYNYNINSSKQNIEINASTKEGYIISGDIGKKTLSKGTNNFVIKVTSPTGDIKNYTLNINYDTKDNKSSINTLNSLTLSNGIIEFSPNVNSYNVDVENDVDEITIESILTDSKSSYLTNFGNRKVKLSVGINEILLKVKAENNDLNIYTLIINRKEKEIFPEIKDIIIEKYPIDFNADNLNYTIIVDKEITKLDIKVVLNDETTKYKISGNEDIKNGSIVKINVSNQEKLYQKEYSIKIIKNENNSKINIYLMILSTMLLIALLIVTILYFKRKNNKKVIFQN